MMNLKLLFIFSIFCCIKTSREVNTDEKRDSFDIETTKNVRCGGEFTEKLSIVESPKNPSKFPASFECLYLLRSPEPCPVNFKLDFVQFNLRDSLGCVGDRLEVGNQDALCGIKIQSRTYFARNGSLQLKFKTDAEVGDSGNGFKILVTRSDCEPEQTTTETILTTQFETEPTLLPFVPYNIPTFTEDPPRCCQNTFNSKRFLLTSPNFPYSLNNNTECTYVIHKADQNICRVRLNFQFFWMGSAVQNNCPQGYLQVDGKYICGCNRELRLITTFGSSNLKVLTFKSRGINTTSQSGFVLEVIQDECPTKYHPDITGLGSIGNDQYKVSWPRTASVQKLQLVNERTEISDDGDSYYRDRPRVVKTVYFFAEPDYNSVPRVQPDIEKTTYLDTESINSVVTNFDHQRCENWNQNQLNVLFERYGRDLQTCRQTQVNEDESNNGRSDCVELDYLEGYFRSPGYPYYYPDNLNICYKFRKQPGYCAIRLLMVDFQLEYSRDCIKDFLSLDNRYRHCGNNLNGRTLNFDLTIKRHQDMTFVSDASFGCRGFSGVYRQIACQSNSPPKPDQSPTTWAPPPASCDRIIREKYFRLEVSGESRECKFRIQKTSEDVCKVNLHFEIFNLKCAEESVVVDGMMFCGRLSGRRVTLNFDDNETTKDINYRSSLESSFGNTKFRIIGEQSNLDPEVPVQRLVQLPSDTTLPRTSRSTNAMDVVKNDHQYYFMRIPKDHFEEICGIISDNQSITIDVCHLLRDYYNATQCSLLHEDLPYVPYQIRTLSNKSDESIQLLYKEIEC